MFYDFLHQCFIVDIGAPTLASLSIFAFEGATRRNVPNLQAGIVSGFFFELLCTVKQHPRIQIHGADFFCKFASRDFSSCVLVFI